MSTKEFFDAVRPLFGGRLNQKQVQGLAILVDATAHLPLAYRAYLLATAQWETAHTMQPVRETLASTDALAVSRLDTAWAKGKLKGVSKPYWRKDADGKAWFGRGYVQLTHKFNYVEASKLTGVDLVSDPSKAMIPAVAAKILVDGSVDGMFTGKRLGTYLDGQTPDYVRARQVINGSNKAAEIAKLARGYAKALALLKEPAPVIDAEPAPAPVLAIDTPAVAPTETETQPGPLARLWAAVVSIFRTSK